LESISTRKSCEDGSSGDFLPPKMTALRKVYGAIELCKPAAVGKVSMLKEDINIKERKRLYKFRAYLKTFQFFLSTINKF